MSAERQTLPTQKHRKHHTVRGAKPGQINLKRPIGLPYFLFALLAQRQDRVGIDIAGYAKSFAVPDDARQPILIAPDIDAANGARFVALVDGQWRDDALDFDRAFHFFNEERIGEARAAWKSLAHRDEVERRYWKQNDAGRWEQAA